MNLLQFLKPTNLETEQEKFLSSSSYNPNFTYDWDRKNIEEWLAQSTQKKYTPFVETVLGQDHHMIVREAKKIFSTDMDQSLFDIANKTMQQPRVLLKGQSIEGLVTLYEEIFNYFGITYTIVLSEERGFAVKPSHSDRSLIINKHLNLDYISAAGLVRHEVVHIIREINSNYNGIEKDDNYLPTEEGLACYVQNYRGSEENYSIYKHAVRYVTTQVALDGSFRNVFDFLRDEGFEKKLAFRRAVRHKMGFTDTSKPGDIMKSSMYFYNLHRVQQLSNEEIVRLYVGKIAMENLHKYPSYVGEIDESKLRNYYDLSSTDASLSSHSI